MKHKVGEKVQIKEKIKVDNSYNGVYFVEEMAKYKNEIVTIKDIKTNLSGVTYYHILEDDGEFFWTDGMLKSRISTNPDKIQDRDVVRVNKNYGIAGAVTGQLAVWYKSSSNYIVFLEKDGFHEGKGELGRELSSCYFIDERYLDKQKLKTITCSKSNVENYTEWEDYFKEHEENYGIFALLRASDKEPLNDEFEIVMEITKDLTDTYLLLKQGKNFYLINKSNLKTQEERKVDEISKQNDEISKLTSTVEKLTKEIKQRDPFQKAMTEAIIEKGKDIATKDLENRIKENLDKFIEENYGVLPKVIKLESETKTKEIQGIFHKDFEKICKLVNKNIPLMLVGGAGAGKNHTLEQVAEALDLDFYTTNAINQEYKLTGFIDANGKYHETEFYKAFTKGGMFFLDEIDASCPEAIIILNGAIANKYFDFPTGRVTAHENFRVVCAGNTYGTGADMVYVGRNVLDGATLDRFIVLNFDYDEEVEKQLAYDLELYNFIKDLRNNINKAGLRYIVSMRALINASKMLELGLPKKDILKDAIIKNMQIDDLNLIASKLGQSSWTNELLQMSDVR